MRAIKHAGVITPEGPAYMVPAPRPGSLLSRFLGDSPDTDPDALLVSYREASSLLGISSDALKQRVSMGRIPPRLIKRTGRRVQFIRSALVSWAEKGSL